jgi:hypothetical protein
MKLSLKVAAAAAACALLVACSKEKGPADLAIKAADQAITAAAPEAQKYIPAQLKEAQDALATAKDQFAKGDYKAALATGTDLVAKTKDLAAAAAAKKDELTKAWTEVSGSLPKMVEAIKSRVEMLGKSKKLPAGVDLAKANEGLAAVTKAWGEASADFTAGKLVEAVDKSKGLKDKATEIMGFLGMQPGGAPAAAAAPAPAKAPAKK